MPNSLDEEETQCLLACEDNLTSTFCDDADHEDIEAQVNNDARKSKNPGKMTSSSSSNKIHLRSPDILSNSFDTLQASSNLTTNTSIAASQNSSSTDTTQSIIYSNPPSKDVLTSEFVVPTLGKD